MSSLFVFLFLSLFALALVVADPSTFHHASYEWQQVDSSRVTLPPGLEVVMHLHKEDDHATEKATMADVRIPQPWQLMLSV